MERLERIPKYEHAAELASSLKPQIDSWIEKGRPVHEGKILVVNLLAEVLKSYPGGPGIVTRFESFPEDLGSIFSEYVPINPREGIGITLEGPNIDYKLSIYSWSPGEPFPFEGKPVVRFEIYPPPESLRHYEKWIAVDGVEFSLSGEDLMPEITPFGPIEYTREWHKFQKNFENNEAATLEIMARLIHVSTVTLAERQKFFQR